MSKHGKTIVMVNDNEVEIRPVPVDLIALLSGVNFASVKKVIAAVNAIREHGVEYEYLMEMSSMPEMHARAEPTAECEQRVEHATRAGQWIRHLPPSPVVEEILCLNERFTD